MRLLFIELSPSGGIFQVSFQLGRHLALSGHDVELLTGPDPELRSDVPTFRVLSGLPTWHAGDPGVSASWLRRLRRLVRAARHLMALVIVVAHVRRTRPDAVFWHPLRFSFDSWCVALTSRLCPGVKMCFVMHEPRPLAEQRTSGSLYRSNRVLDRSLALAVHRMDVIFTLSERVRDEVLKTWQPRARVVVIPLGSGDVLPSADEIAPIANTEPHVLFFGSWIRHKGIDVLIEAFQIVREHEPRARLTIAGAVSGDVDYAEIARMADRVPGVTLAPGYVAMPDVKPLFESARVVAVPYLRANQSAVAHLAQTFGRPVVATSVGDIPDVVPHGEAGLIVPPGDVPALAAALIQLLDDPDAAARMGRGGRDRLEQESSWSDIAEKVAATLTSGDRASR